MKSFWIIFLVGTAWGSSIEDLKYECSTHANSIEENLHPWVTFIPLQTRTYNPGANVQCIGALISKRHVITASTCLQFVVSEVYLGQSNESSYTLSDMVRVPVKHWTTYDKADVALLKLDSDVQFSDTLRPICLPFQEYGKPTTDTILNVVSWTRDAGSVTKKIIESRVSRCKGDHQLCLHPTGQQVVCYGDEGSPITYYDGSNWILHGILLNVFDSDGSLCARRNPAVGLKITDDIVDWIIEKMEH